MAFGNAIISRTMTFMPWQKMLKVRAQARPRSAMKPRKPKNTKINAKATGADWIIGSG